MDLAKTCFEAARQTDVVKDQAWIELAFDEFRNGETSAAMHASGRS